MGLYKTVVKLSLLFSQRKTDSDCDSRMGVAQGGRFKIRLTARALTLWNSDAKAIWQNSWTIHWHCKAKKNYLVDDGSKETCNIVQVNPALKILFSLVTSVWSLIARYSLYWMTQPCCDNWFLSSWDHILGYKSLTWMNSILYIHLHGAHHSELFCCP